MSEKNKPTVKQQMEQLEKALAWFDGEEFNLDQAFAKFEEASELSKNLEETLMEMKSKIEVLATLHQG